MVYIHKASGRVAVLVLASGLAPPTQGTRCAVGVPQRLLQRDLCDDLKLLVRPIVGVVIGRERIHEKLHRSELVVVITQVSNRTLTFNLLSALVLGITKLRPISYTVRPLSFRETSRLGSSLNCR